MNVKTRLTAITDEVQSIWATADAEERAASSEEIAKAERLIGEAKSLKQLAELGKTTRSRRQVPLSERARAALDSIPPRLDTTFVFPAKRGGPFDLANFRRREWQPAIEASGIRKPARIYDLRSTFASNALAAGVSVFELARIMGTSVAMIERHYGTLIEGAGADIARRLDAFDAAQERSDGHASDV